MSLLFSIASTVAAPPRGADPVRHKTGDVASDEYRASLVSGMTDAPLEGLREPMVALLSGPYRAERGSGISVDDPARRPDYRNVSSSMSVVRGVSGGAVWAAGVARWLNEMSRTDDNAFLASVLDCLPKDGFGEVQSTLRGLVDEAFSGRYVSVSQLRGFVDGFFKSQYHGIRVGDPLRPDELASVVQSYRNRERRGEDRPMMHDFVEYVAAERGVAVEDMDAACSILGSGEVAFDKALVSVGQNVLAEDSLRETLVNVALEANANERAADKGRQFFLNPLYDTHEKTWLDHGGAGSLGEASGAALCAVLPICEAAASLEQARSLCDMMCDVFYPAGRRPRKGDDEAARLAGVASAQRRRMRAAVDVGFRLSHPKFEEGTDIVSVLKDRYEINVAAPAYDALARDFRSALVAALYPYNNSCSDAALRALTYGGAVHDTMFVSSFLYGCGHKDSKGDHLVRQALDEGRFLDCVEGIRRSVGDFENRVEAPLRREMGEGIQDRLVFEYPEVEESPELTMSGNALVIGETMLSADADMVMRGHDLALELGLQRRDEVPLAPVAGKVEHTPLDQILQPLLDAGSVIRTINVEDNSVPGFDGGPVIFFVPEDRPDVKVAVRREYGEDAVILPASAYEAELQRQVELSKMEQSTDPTHVESRGVFGSMLACYDGVVSTLDKTAMPAIKAYMDGSDIARSERMFFESFVDNNEQLHLCTVDLFLSYRDMLFEAAGVEPPEGNIVVKDAVVPWAGHLPDGTFRVGLCYGDTFIGGFDKPAFGQPRQVGTQGIDVPRYLHEPFYKVYHYRERAVASVLDRLVMDEGLGVEVSLGAAFKDETWAQRSAERAMDSLAKAASRGMPKAYLNKIKDTIDKRLAMAKAMEPLRNDFTEVDEISSSPVYEKKPRESNVSILQESLALSRDPLVLEMDRGNGNDQSKGMKM